MDRRDEWYIGSSERLKSSDTSKLDDKDALGIEQDFADWLGTSRSLTKAELFAAIDAKIAKLQDTEGEDDETDN